MCIYSYIIEYMYVYIHTHYTKLNMSLHMKNISAHFRHTTIIPAYYCTLLKSLHITHMSDLNLKDLWNFCVSAHHTFLCKWNRSLHIFCTLLHISLHITAHYTYLWPLHILVIPSQGLCVMSLSLHIINICALYTKVHMSLHMKQISAHSLHITTHISSHYCTLHIPLTTTHFSDFKSGVMCDVLVSAHHPYLCTSHKFYHISAHKTDLCKFSAHYYTSLCTWLFITHIFEKLHMLEVSS